MVISRRDENTREREDSKASGRCTVVFAPPQPSWGSNQGEPESSLQTHTATPL